MHGNLEGLTLKVRTQTGGSSKKCSFPYKEEGGENF